MLSSWSVALLVRVLKMSIMANSTLKTSQLEITFRSKCGFRFFMHGGVMIRHERSKHHGTSGVRLLLNWPLEPPGFKSIFLLWGHFFLVKMAPWGMPWHKSRPSSTDSRGRGNNRYHWQDQNGWRKIMRILDRYRSWRKCNLMLWC